VLGRVAGKHLVNYIQNGELLCSSGGSDLQSRLNFILYAGGNIGGAGGQITLTIPQANGAPIVVTISGVCSSFCCSFLVPFTVVSHYTFDFCSPVQVGAASVGGASASAGGSAPAGINGAQDAGAFPSLAHVQRCMTDSVRL
jgi:hypothetical protein